MGWHEIAGLAPLMVLIVLIGVIPGPFLDRIRPSAGEIDKNLQDQRVLMVAAGTSELSGRTIVVTPRNAAQGPRSAKRRANPRVSLNQGPRVSLNHGPKASPSNLMPQSSEKLHDPSDRVRIGAADLRILIPEFLLLVAGVAMMTAAPFYRWPRRIWCTIAAGVLVASLLALLAVSEFQTEKYMAVALNDALGYYGRMVVLLSGLVLLAMAHEEPADETSGEFFGALLLINAGAMLVATANELVFLFVGLELVSIPTYMLLYLTRRTSTTQESATKYFFLSIFSSGLLLYGLAFLYGVAGVSNLKALTTLSWFLPSIPHPQLGLIAVVFVLAGLCFRVAAVPFHFYAPDVYQGSPTVLAALLSWVPKAVGFVAMVRALTAVISVKGPEDPLVQKAVMISWVIAAATMIVGNTLALLQNNLKRLLAYSSIAHAGYLMIGVTVAFTNGSRSGKFYYGCESIFFYLVAYAPDDPGRFRGDHRAGDGGSRRGDGRGPRGSGHHPTVAGPGPGDLPAQSQRHPAAGRVLGQIRDLLSSLRGQPG